MCGYKGVSWRRLAAAGEGGKGGGGRRGGYLSMVVRKIFCSFFLPGGRHLVIGEEITLHQLPTTIVTRFCGHTEFLRALGHRKGRVQNLNSNPEVCNTNILIPESQVALVETSKNTPRIGSDFVPTLRVGIRILYPNLGYCASVGGSLCDTSKTCVRQVQLTSHESKPHEKHNSPNKHHHHGGGAANPCSGVDLMNPRRPRGGRPYACSFRCCHRSDLIDSIN